MKRLKNLRRNFERFCYKNRHLGIPNLMLYIAVGSGLLYLFTMATGNTILYSLLAFDRELILQGQVWRLLTYVLTYSGQNVLYTVIGLVCYYSLGRAMEQVWGTFRFNLFYFTGVILMDVYTLIFGGYATVEYLNLSLFLGYATLYPDTHFLLFFIIPVRAWIFALFYLGITAYQVLALSTPYFLFPYNLFPLVALANYFLFFGADIKNVLPLSWRVKASRKKQKPKTYAPQQPARKPIQFPSGGAAQQEAYNHKCTVCGRTDVSHPDLEFRYCSRCNGYHCYCQDHISNHTHIES